jgi:hypothetical protein
MIYKNNVLNILTSEIDIHKNKHLGYDERYVNYYTNVTSSKLLKSETEDIEKIGRYMDVLKKINKLENSNIHDAVSAARVVSAIEESAESKKWIAIKSAAGTTAAIAK